MVYNLEVEQTNQIVHSLKFVFVLPARTEQSPSAVKNIVVWVVKYFAASPSFS